MRRPLSQSLRLEKILWWGKRMALAVIFVALVWLFFSFKPRSVECVTEENTFCPEAVTRELQVLREIRWWQLSGALDRLERRLQQVSPDLNNAQGRLEFTGKAVVTVSMASPQFPVRINNEDFWVRENGALTQSNTFAPPVLQFATESAWLRETSVDPEKLNAEQIKTLGELYRGLQLLAPRVTKIVVVDLTNIYVTIENVGSVLVRADSSEEVLRQLSTLQAFLRSSTIDQNGQEVDVRFKDIYTR